MPLEVPKTEMVSLQVLVDRPRNIGIQKQLRKPCRAPRETIGTKVSENGADFGILGGVDLTSILGLKTPRQIHASFPNKICAVLVRLQSKRTSKYIRKRNARNRSSWERLIIRAFRCLAFSGVFWRLPHQEEAREGVIA